MNENYKKWIKNLSTHSLTVEKSNMTWIELNGSTKEIKDMGKKKLETILLEIEKRNSL